MDSSSTVLVMEPADINLRLAPRDFIFPPGCQAWLGLDPEHNRYVCVVTGSLSTEERVALREDVARKIATFHEHGPDLDGGWSHYPGNKWPWQAFQRREELPPLE